VLRTTDRTMITFVAQKSSMTQPTFFHMNRTADQRSATEAAADPAIHGRRKTGLGHQESSQCSGMECSGIVYSQSLEMMYHRRSNSMFILARHATKPGHEAQLQER